MKIIKNDDFYHGKCGLDSGDLPEIKLRKELFSLLGEMKQVKRPVIRNFKAKCDLHMPIFFLKKVALA